MKQERTMKELAQDALDVQNACNIGGVARSLVDLLSDLYSKTNGTDERNSHPLVKLYVDKLLSLSGEAGHNDYEYAYNEVAKC